jgi:hypothetical protein
MLDCSRNNFLRVAEHTQFVRSYYPRKSRLEVQNPKKPCYQDRGWFPSLRAIFGFSVLSHKIPSSLGKVAPTLSIFG